METPAFHALSGRDLIQEFGYRSCSAHLAGDSHNVTIGADRHFSGPGRRAVSPRAAV
jgi:hypothetical protein